jgi:hypothetical protein
MPSHQAASHTHGASHSSDQTGMKLQRLPFGASNQRRSFHICSQGAEFITAFDMVCVKAANPIVVLKKQGVALKEGKISRI